MLDAGALPNLDEALVGIISDMLNPVPEERPTTAQLLSYPCMVSKLKEHIQLTNSLKAKLSDSVMIDMSDSEQPKHNLWHLLE